MSKNFSCEYSSITWINQSEKIACGALVLSFFAGSLAGTHAADRSCPGLFIRDSLSYDNRRPSGSLEMTGSIVAKGTRDTIIGYTTVGGVMYYVQLRAYLHRPSDIDLQPGCKLGPYDN